MSSTDTDRLIEDYLRRLEHAAAHLPRTRRAELVADIRGHVDAALLQEQAGGEAAVRNVLDRLGPPVDIVEAAQPASPDADRRVGRLEVGALIGLLVPFIGWGVGAVLVLASRAWSRRDKLIGGGLLLLPIVILGLGVVAISGPSGGEESAPPGDTRPVGEKVEEPLDPGPFGLIALGGRPPECAVPGMAVAPGPHRQPDRCLRTTARPPQLVEPLDAPTGGPPPTFPDRPPRRTFRMCSCWSAWCKCS